MDLDWLVRDQGDSLRGRGAFLQNRSDRSYPLPSRLQDRSYKSIPPKEQQELGYRQSLRSGDLRRACLEIWRVVWRLFYIYKKVFTSLLGRVLQGLNHPKLYESPTLRTTQFWSYKPWPGIGQVAGQGWARFGQESRYLLGPNLQDSLIFVS